MEKTTLVVPISIALKDAAGTYAQTNDMSLSKLVRVALAQYIGYDLASEGGSSGKRGRPTKYSNDEERKQAARNRASDRYDLIRKLTEDHKKQERIRGAMALQASLDRHAGRQ